MAEKAQQALYAIEEIEKFLVDVSESQQISFTDPHGGVVAADEVFAAEYGLPMFVIAAISIAKNAWQWSEEIVLYAIEPEPSAFTGYRLVNNPSVTPERCESAKMLILLYLLQTLNTFKERLGGEKDSEGRVAISIESLAAYLEGNTDALAEISGRANDE